MDPLWQYNELKQVGTDYSDPANVKSYDSQMQKLRDIKQEVNYIIKRLDLKPHHTVLEFGTGTGEFVLEAARRCAAVYAVDVSSVMLNCARLKAEQQGITNIQFYHAGFLTYEHQREPLDAAVSQLALHHLPDFWKMIALRRIFNMLKKGGKFYLMDTVYSFDPDEHEVFFNNWVSRVEQAAGEELAWDVAKSIEEEYVTIGWIMEGLLTKSGFHIEKADYPEGFLAIYLCNKR